MNVRSQFERSRRSADLQSAVSPICNRLGAGNTGRAGAVVSPAGCKPAIRQIANLRYDQSAFTLIEVVISSGLMALILVAAYLCLNAGFASKKMIEPRADIIQNARVAMNIIAADLRSACAMGKDYQFIGVHRLIGEMEADNLDFATHNYTPRRPLEGDFCQQSFYVDRDPETGGFSLWRRRNPVIATDPLSGGSKEEIAKGVVGVRFEYTDGLDWYDTWGETNPRKRDAATTLEPNMIGMPEAVRITLMLDSNPKAKKVLDGASVTGSEPPAAAPPLVFKTVARLNLAASSMRATSGATAASPGAQDAAAQRGEGLQQ